MIKKDLIGNTRTVFLEQRGDADLYIKLEGDNLTGSLKDRSAKQLLDALEESGELSKGKEVLAPSSGSFAVAITYQALLRGYKTTVVVNEKISGVNLQLLEKFGANIVRHGKVTMDSMLHCQELIKENPGKYAFADQLNHPAAVQAHFLTTGPEVLEDLPNIRAIVGSMGSGATLCGIAKFVNKHSHDVKIIASVGVPGDHKKITGTYSEGPDYRSPFISELQDNKLLAKEIEVFYDEALDGAKKLLLKGFHVGPQSGGVYVAACKAIDELNISGPVVMISGDTGLKWL